jgi:DNA-binding Lrp family transcriptional regulator
MSERVKDRLSIIQSAITNLVKKAEEDGIVTEEEAKLLETAKNGLGEYEQMVEDALEDGIITQEEMNDLIDLEENLMSDSYFTAMEDNVIDEDEMLLLKILIKTIDKQASVSWLDEDKN